MNNQTREMTKEEKAESIIKFIEDNDINAEFLYNWQIEFIKELCERQLHNGWISASERLPEDNNFYLVTLSDMRVEYLFYEQDKNEWYFVADGSEEDNTDWREKAKDVIAWQPLPLPYQS